MEYIVAAVMGYLFGCMNTAYFVAKLKGVNIKKVGTNNAGASNVFISVGKLYGVIAGAGDIFKSFAASMLVYLLFDGNFNLAVFSGVMAVIGHIFPFWMKFNGGKGLASLMGVILFIDFQLFAFMGIILITITLLTDYISLGTLAVATLMPIYTILFKLDKLSENSLFTIIFVVLAVIIWYKHKDNIIRIKNGTEIGFLRKNKKKKEP